MIKKMKSLAYAATLWAAPVLAADTTDRTIDRTAPTGTSGDSGGGLSNIPVPNIAEGATVDPGVIVLRVINYALFFIGAVALGFIIYGAILFVTSGGDSDKVTKARNTLIYAIIGIVVIVLSYAIVNWAAGGAVNIFKNPV